MLGNRGEQWRQLDPDQVATISTTEDWDELFQRSDLTIPSAAIRLHNERAGDYLALSSKFDTAKGTTSGSIYNVGLRVSGSQQYGTRFKDRVLQIMKALRDSVNGMA
jgi:hypothetical protein